MSYIKVVYNNIKKKTKKDDKVIGVPFSEYEFNCLVKKIVDDSTTGTWIDMKGLSAIKLNEDGVHNRYKARVWDKDAYTGYLILEFPVDNFDFNYAGIPLLLGTIAGDILSYPELYSINIADIHFPEEVEDFFKGPKCGISGVRELLKVYDRPILAFTAKPRLGLTPEEYAKLLVEVAKGGVDIVEDDERLVNPVYCNIIDRAEAVLKAFKNNGIKTIYSVNITGNANKAVEMAEKLIDLGIKMLKIDVLPAGFAELQAVSEFLHEKKYDVPITVYPGMGQVYKCFSKKVILKLARMAGADIIYAATPYMSRIGRHDVESTSGDVVFKIQDAVADLERVKELHYILTGTKKYKPSLPTVSTSIHPGVILLLQQLFNKKDFAYFVGGTIVAVPDEFGGPKAGAEICLEAIKLGQQGKFELGDFSAKSQKILDYFNHIWDLPSEKLIEEFNKCTK